MWQKSHSFDCTCLVTVNSFRNINSIIIYHFYIIHNLYRRSSKKICGQYLLFSWKASLTTIIMLQISFYTLQIFIILFGGNSLSSIFVYFSSELSQFLVLKLIKSLILLHSSLCFSIICLLLLVGTRVKYLSLLIFSKYPFTLLIIRYKGIKNLSY